MQPSSTIQHLSQAARIGGEIVKDYFGQALEPQSKSTLGDLRTKADVESEKTIINYLTKAFHGFNIFGEESGHTDKASEYTLVIDPLDGTNNFVMGIPNFTVSIALLKGSEAIAAAIYHPILDHLFHAEKSKGAFINNKPIRANAVSDINHATISYVCGYTTSRTVSDAVIQNLRARHIKRLIDHWAPAYDYCLLATGRIEGIICKEGDFEDYAAGKLIVREAGGRISGFDGKPVDDRADTFIASNGTALHDEFRGILAKHAATNI